MKDNCKNKFIAYLSHELRNPLQSIIMSSYLLENSLQNISDTKIKTQLSVLNKSCNDMKRIIDDILDLTKIENDDFTLNYEECNLAEIMENIFNEHKPIADKKNLMLGLHFAKDIPHFIYCDSVRLSQILSNLILNAIKYTETGNINITVKYIENCYQFIIEDTGVGIDEHNINLLFTEFCKISNSHVQKNDLLCSNGLGLFLSHKIAKKMNGTISVSSTVGKGSKFILTIPEKSNLKSSFVLLNTLNAPIIKKDLKGKILIVDDDEKNTMMLKMMLEHCCMEYKYDLDIECIYDGLNAFELTKINKYDIIFMDINMNGVDGHTACKMIKNIHNDIIIVATTGNILVYSKNDNTFDHILIKPFGINTILYILNKYLH